PSSTSPRVRPPERLRRPPARTSVGAVRRASCTRGPRADAAPVRRRILIGLAVLLALLTGARAQAAAPPLEVLGFQTQASAAGRRAERLPAARDVGAAVCRPRLRPPRARYGRRPLRADDLRRPRPVGDGARADRAAALAARRGARAGARRPARPDPARRREL